MLTCLLEKAVKIIVKGDQYGADIKKAIETLHSAVEDFRWEAQTCDAQRLGRVEDGVNETNKLLSQMMKDQAKLREEKRRLEENKARESKEYESIPQESRQKVQQEELQIAVYNTYYGFLIANPAVDSRTGKGETAPKLRGADWLWGHRTDFNPVSVKELKGLLEACKEISTAAGARLSSVDAWLQELQRSDISSTSHCEECLRNSWSLNFKGQDSMAWIMGSGELRSWLRSSRSSILVIDSETRPDDTLNPLTMSIALTVHTLTTKADFPVLSFFCGLHTNDAYDEELSGPVGMLNCLNAQFLTYLNSRNPGIFLPVLEGDRYRRRSQRHITEALGLLQLLVQRLTPNEDAVIVVVDSACRLVGPRPKAEKALKGILDIAKKAPLTFKVLISDMLSSDPLDGRAAMKLFVPDYIDGGRQGMNMDMMQSEAKASTATFRARRNAGSSESECSASEGETSGCEDETDSSEDDVGSSEDD